jgi:hypothetical protein
VSLRLLSGLAANYGAPVNAQDAFDAILALLSATSYTLRFAEDLEDVFPHVPFPGDHALFLDAVALGREIRAVETFARPVLPQFLTPAVARMERRRLSFCRPASAAAASFSSALIGQDASQA